MPTLLEPIDDVRQFLKFNFFVVGNNFLIFDIGRFSFLLLYDICSSFQQCLHRPRILGQNNISSHQCTRRTGREIVEVADWRTDDEQRGHAAYRATSTASPSESRKNSRRRP